MSNFEDFIWLFSLSKTLRFELVPVWETRDNMNKHLEYDEKLQTFLKDQKIEDAYQTLKPILDNIHEEFITKSLESENTQNIDFSGYLNLKKEKKDLNEKTQTIEKNRIEENINKLETELRKKFEESYKITGKYLELKIKWKNSSENNDENDENYIDEDENNVEKNKEKEEGFRKLLNAKNLLKYIKKNVNKFTEIKSKEEIESALKNFEKFVTYFKGFETNRLNYYETKKEASTAVATRIINDNLPKFVDNVFLYEKQKDEYEKIFNELKNFSNEKEVRQFYNNVFDINEFKNCLSQSKIDYYNEKIADNNYLINLYNQLNWKKEWFKRLSQFKILYKQIGCGKKSEFISQIKDDDDLKDTLLEVKSAGEKYFIWKNEGNTIWYFINFLANLETYEWVYWNKQAINTISGKYFTNWHDLWDRMSKKYKDWKSNKNSEEYFKIPDAIELSSLFEIIDEVNWENWKEQGVFFKFSIFEWNNKERNIKIIEDSDKPSKALLKLIFADLEDSAKRFIDNKEVIEDWKFKIDEWKAKIKLWLDETLTINRILKYFITKENKRKWKSQIPEIENLLKVLIFEFDWFRSYDAIRNYLTKKPQSEINKLKLNFENGILLDGWSDWQEKSKWAVLLKNNDKFYVGILGKNKKIFDTENEGNEVYNADNENIGRLILANLKFQTLAWKGFLWEFWKSYGDMGKENQNESIKSLKKIIEDRYVKKYPLLQSILNKSYIDKKEFDGDIEEILKNSYVCEFKPVNWNKIEEFVIKGDLYLFEIKCNQNKIQWNYWKETFVKNSIIQLNGGAKIFFRSAWLEKKIKKGYENKKDKEMNINYIIDNKRFTEEKFLFHCPIKINYKSKSYSKPQYAINEINDKINKFFLNTRNSNKICFLWIDRGEKHLAYYSLVNQNWEILKQWSFNLPFIDKDKKYRSIEVERKSFERDNKNQIIFDENWKEKVKIETIECWNYNDLLETRSFDRDFARKNWQTIWTIKELKDGYISQVVHEIVKFVIENNAFIVLENLNSGFKNSRKKIEKQVYQKLELALAKKLNFVVDKNAKDWEIMSVQKALQLTPPVNNFWDIENAKQYGIMFYTRANYTSQTDPKTWWRKSIYLKKWSEENIKKQICEKFNEIGFDWTDYYFSYTDKNTKKEWKLYSWINWKTLDRYKTKLNNDTNVWEISKEVNIIENLNWIFKNFDKTKSLKDQITEWIKLEKIDNKFTAWETLIFTIDLIQQIRNSWPKDQDWIITHDDDFILSPVRDDNWKHFDSRDFIENPILPNSWDANGAYNIARKWIMMFEHIKRDLQLYITDIEYDSYLYNKECWNKYLEENKKKLENKKKKDEE